MNLKDLAANHPYYCSDSNFYSNEPAMQFSTVSAFLREFGDADIDMNLCFRWDVTAGEDGGCYSAKVFLIHQRKGIFRPIEITRITEADVGPFTAYLCQHKERLLEIWSPL